MPLVLLRVLRGQRVYRGAKVMSEPQDHKVVKEAQEQQEIQDLLALKAPRAIKAALVQLDQQAALDRLAIRVLQDRVARLEALVQPAP